MSSPRGIPPIGSSTLFSTSDGRHWSLRLEPGPAPAGALYIPPVPADAPVPAAPPGAARMAGPRAVVAPKKGKGKPRVAARPPVPALPTTTSFQVPTPPAAALDLDWGVFDHPVIGGRITACVLLYGDYPELHRRCLDALLGTTVPERVMLRVGTNAVCAATAAYLRALHDQGRVEKIYWNDTNRKKYPVQRDMYHDPITPLRDKWVFWFDDDSICVRPDWAIVMAELITKHAAEGYHQYGPHYFYTLSPAQMAAIKKCGWYRGKPFRNRHGQPVPNGNLTHFATGSFHALSVEAIHTCDIPEVSLQHNGGDVLTGEQLYQGGFRLKHVGGNKNLVNWSSTKRRGVNETHWHR